MLHIPLEALTQDLYVFKERADIELTTLRTNPGSEFRVSHYEGRVYMLDLLLDYYQS